MRKTTVSGVLSLILFLTVASSAFQTLWAQAAKITKVTVDAVPSPQFQLSGNKKPFKSTKRWLEAEIVFMVNAANKPKDGYLPDSLEVEIFVLVEGADRKPKLLKHTGTYSNVAVGENQAVAVYLPPREFARLVGKDKPSRGDVKGYAVNIKYAGKSLGTDLKGMNGAATKGPVEMEMLPKSKTPFRDLYYDNYLVDSNG